MIRIKLFPWLSIFVYILTLLLVSFTIWTPQAQAGPCIPWINCSQTGETGFGSRGGVKRGACAASVDAASLMAFTPESKLGSTVEAYPTFWFHLPAYKPSIKLAKFIMLDENKHVILQKPIFFQLPEKHGVAGFTLPRTSKALEVGKQYSWYLSIVCDPQKPSRNPEVTGLIKRVPNGSLSEKYIVYNSDRTEVVWYDTVTQLIKNRNKYSQDWKELLKKLKLSDPVAIAQLQPLESPPRGCEAL